MSARAHALIRQMFVYAVIGGASFVIDFVVYAALTRGINFFGRYFLFANTISFVSSVTFSFFLNRRFTFGRTGPGARREYARFFAVAVLGFLLNTGFFWLFVRGGLYDLIAKTTAAAVVFLWNFTLQRVWTFRPQKEYTV